MRAGARRSRATLLTSGPFRTGTFSSARIVGARKRGPDARYVNGRLAVWVARAPTEPARTSVRMRAFGVARFTGMPGWRVCGRGGRGRRHGTVDPRGVRQRAQRASECAMKENLVK